MQAKGQHRLIGIFLVFSGIGFVLQLVRLSRVQKLLPSNFQVDYPIILEDVQVRDQNMSACLLVAMEMRVKLQLNRALFAESQAQKQILKQARRFFTEGQKKVPTGDKWPALGCKLALAETRWALAQINHIHLNVAQINGKI